MIALLAAVAFLIRIVPRLSRPDALASDTYFHMYCARAIRANGMRIPRTLPRVVLAHEYTYPFLYHYLLALFPEGARPWAERLTGAVFDTVNVLLLYYFSVWALTAAGSSAARETALLTAALFAFSPALLRFGSGPRAYNGSPRILGQTLYFVHLACSYVALSQSSWTAAMASLLAGAVLIINAQFGNQVLLFFGVFFAAFVSPFYLLLLGASVLLATLATGGMAWEMIRAQVKHMMFYYRHLQQIVFHARPRTFLGDWLPQAKGHVLGVVRRRAIMPALDWFYGEPYPPHLYLSVFPQFVLVPWMVFQSRRLSAFDDVLLVWAGAGLVWAILTKLKVFLSLGEGERYLEYALYPSLLLFVETLIGWRLQAVLFAFLAYSVVSAVFYYRQYSIDYGQKNRDYADVKAMYERLNALTPGVVMPIGYAHYQALYHSRFPVLTHGANIDLDLLPLEEFMLVFGMYPFPSARFAEIVERYDVRYFVSAPDWLKQYRDRIAEDREFFDHSIELLWERPSLVIGRVRRGSELAPVR